MARRRPIKRDPRQTAIGIVRRLREAGHEAWWVGGCVRNRLLGLEPKDYDIATSARPPQIQRLFPRSDLVGAHFGVVLVVAGGRHFEVATFRRDGRYLDRRRPRSVSFGSLHDDARRRDFTINALYYDPLEDRLLDPVGGLRDLRARRLRCIGDPFERFAEDALRLLRAIRFAVRFGLAIERATWAALRACAPLIADISPERIRDELVAMLTGPRPGQALRRLSSSGLLRVIVPEVEAMKGVEQPPEFHPEGDVFTHTCRTLDALDAPSPTLAMAALLHDVGKPPAFRRAEDRIRFDRHESLGADIAAAVCRRLRFPRRQIETIVARVARHMGFMNLMEMRPSTLKRFMADPGFDEDLALHRADCLASHGDASGAEYCERKRAEFVRAAGAIVPPPLITGDDLIAMGYAPGPRFGKMLRAVADAQMEGALRTPAQARDWIRAHFVAP